MSEPRATICLPTLDGAEDLARLLRRLAQQTLAGGFEILAIDSSSRDETRELLAAAGVPCEVIARDEFRHGRTRNRFVERARGSALVFFSQDAEPASDDFLARLLAALDDGRVAGAYGRVLPRPGDDPLTARTVLSAPEAADVPHTTCPEDVAPPARRAVAFNNVASAIRREVLRAIPFPDVDFGEDVAWAERAVAAGWCVRFVPAAVVWHSHKYTARAAFERYRIDAEFHRHLHGRAVRPNVLSVVRGLVWEVREDARYLASTRAPRRLVHLLHSPWLRGAQVLGQYVGSRANGCTGRRA
jgi:rhamnosyltransferase